ncbi:MAG: pseudouridine synthase [Patescibacteria group bacterium]|jgi:pseudouridine synthase
MTNLRLNKFLSQSGVTSRRNADDFIKSGRVFINGEKASIGCIVSDNDSVTVDKKPVKLPDQFQYYALYKPAGLITSLTDDQGPSIRKLIPKETRLFPIGRLDKDTEGLLILTNDGDFANELSHPSFTKEKVYHLEYGGKPTNIGKEGIIRQFLKGIMYNSKRYYVDKARFIGGSKIEVTLHQGKSRQLRIMAGKIGLEVKSLKRVAIGKLKLSSLKISPGQIAKISKRNII